METKELEVFTALLKQGELIAQQNTVILESQVKILKKLQAVDVRTDAIFELLPSIHQLLEFTAQNAAASRNTSAVFITHLTKSKEKAMEADTALMAKAKERTSVFRKEFQVAWKAKYEDIFNAAKAE